jgi:hypothetical protein
MASKTSSRTIAFGVHCHHGGNDALAEEVAVDCALWLRATVDAEAMGDLC